MSDDAQASLANRVARLERLVEELRDRFPTETADSAGATPDEAPPGAPPGGPGAPPRAGTADPGRPHAPAGEPTAEPQADSGAGASIGGAAAGMSGDATEASLGGAEEGPDWSRLGEQWLGRLGVGFLILALAFLFKLALDRGWITPPLRLAFGLLLGTGLLVAGLRLEESRRRYSQVLMGGAVGVFYLVGFAGYQLYGLLPYTVAFSYMATVTLLALVLASRQDRATLAAIGAAGGLATPFLLPTSDPSVLGLVLYTCLIVAGAGAVQIWRGWITLHVTLFVGGFAVLAFAATQPPVAERLAVPLAVWVWWLVVGVSPLFRQWFLDQAAGDGEEVESDPSVFGGAPPPVALVSVAGILTSLAAAALAALAWDLERAELGLLILLPGLLFGAAAALGRSVREPAVLVAAVLIPAGTWALVPEPAVFFILSLEAAAIHMVAARFALPSLHALGHALVAILGVWFIEVAVDRQGPNPLDGWGTASLGAIAVTFATSYVFTSPTLRTRYRLGAYAALLSWLLVELTPLSNGPALVSISWGLLGTLLLVLGWGRERRGLQQAGLATLGLTAGKLLLVDMAQLDVVWRILVFLGFGGAFLALSYMINHPRRRRGADRSGA
jgi:uncharacterized membrane protein